MRSTLAWVCLLAVFGCEDDSRPAHPSPAAPTPASIAATDALWALTPAGARGAIVASPRALGLAEDAFALARGFVDSTPDLAPMKRELDELLARTGGSTKLADWGLTRDKGAALFLLHDGLVAILPLANRDVFLAKVKGKKGQDADVIDDTTCKTVKGVYACATSAALLDTLGKGDLKSKLVAANARGELEVVGIELPFTDAATGTVAAAIQLARGQFAIRGAIGAPPAELTSKLGQVAKPRTDRNRSAGFGVIDVRPFLAGVPDVPIVGDITFSQLTQAIAGPLTINIPAGEATIEMELPLTDGAKVKKFVEHCTDFAPLAQLGATVVQGGCHIKVPDSAIDLEAWVDGNTLRLGKRGVKATGKHVPMSPLGQELANGEWAFAFWGRGTLFGKAPVPVPPAEGELPPESAVAIRFTTLIDEAGVGARMDGELLRFVAVARSAFANSDAVLAKVLAITAEDLVKGRAADKAAPIARVARASPFGQDFAAGQSGMIIPTSLLGMATNVILPRFLQAMRPPPLEEEPPPPVQPTP